MEAETEVPVIEKYGVFAFVYNPGSHEQKWHWLQQAESEISNF